MKRRICRHPRPPLAALLGALTLVGLGCSSGLGPDEARYLGSILTADSGIEVDNPDVLRRGDRAWRLRILTGGSCPFVRSEAEVIYRERVALVYPYEVRKLCAERPRRSGLHEVDVAFAGDGPWSIFVMGGLGVQWADTVEAASGR